MALHGFKVFDSDMHIMEPPDLWQRFIADEYRSMAPVGVTSENVRDLRLQYPGNEYDWVSFIVRGKNYDRNQKLYADHARRGWGPEVQLEAMDVEGLDAAVMFPSRALTALTDPKMEVPDSRTRSRARTTTGSSTSAKPIRSGCSAPE